MLCPDPLSLTTFLHLSSPVGHASEHASHEMAMICINLVDTDRQLLQRSAASLLTGEVRSRPSRGLRQRVLVQALARRGEAIGQAGQS